MRFEPRTPDASVNVSKTHPLADAGLLILAVGALFTAVTVAIVFSVEIALRFVSVETETKVFGNWLPDDLIVASQSDSAVTQANDLLQRLAAHWPDTAYQFRLVIADSDMPNAMALPGGLIIVTSALLNQIESENALAFVLGHELGHFRHRDHFRQLGRATALGILFASMGSNGGSIGFATTDLTLRSFSREQESDADQFGLSLMYAEYGHINDAWAFFERIDNGGNRIGRYFETHPQPSDRIVRIRDYAAERGWPPEGKLTAWGR